MQPSKRDFLLVVLAWLLGCLRISPVSQSFRVDTAQTRGTLGDSTLVMWGELETWQKKKKSTWEDSSSRRLLRENWAKQASSSQDLGPKKNTWESSDLRELNQDFEREPTWASIIVRPGKEQLGRAHTYLARNSGLGGRRTGQASPCRNPAVDGTNAAAFAQPSTPCVRQPLFRAGKKTSTAVPVSSFQEWLA